MNGNKRREEDEEAKRRIRRRVYTTIDEADYEYFPEKKQPGFYDNDVHQRVAVYARVSTGSWPSRTTVWLRKVSAQINSRSFRQKYGPALVILICGTLRPSVENSYALRVCQW